MKRLLGGFIVTAVVLEAMVGVVSTELTIDAPASLAATAQRIREADYDQLTQALARAGLDPPPRVHVTLIADGDPAARRTPDWIVGQAIAPRDVIVFPERVASYPYDSLESVVRHEIVHLALAERAGRFPLPRWFHEGVAVSVEAGWGFTAQLRLRLAIAEHTGIADVVELFESDSQHHTTLAYLLAAALIDDVRRRHGAAAPGAIAGRVAEGRSFERAFEMQTGETVDEAVGNAWGAYRRWTSWVPLMTSESATWVALLGLAAVVYVIRRTQRARRRRQWDEEDRTA